jgi:hypothetical protein
MSCPGEGTPWGSPGVASFLLQLRETPQGTEIRAQSQDPCHASRIDHQAANVQGDFLLDDAFLGAAKCYVRVLRLGHVGRCGQIESFYGRVATLDDGSTNQLFRQLATVLL